MRLTREAALGATIAVAIAFGVAVDMVGAQGSLPAETVSGPRFVERATFCPPTPRTDEVESRVAITTGSDDPIPVGIEPELEERSEISSDQMVLHPRSGPFGADVVGYGGSPIAGVIDAVRSPVTGVGSTGCSPVASRTWYFAAGSSTLGSDERLLVYNPFPDEAVVRVTFFTKSGLRNKANLQDIAVGARSSRVISVNDFVPIHRMLGARVDAVRGRFVVWKLMYAKPEGKPPGVQLSLGALAPATTWHFPDGAVADGIDQKISLVNPGEEEAVVSVTLTTSDEVIQPDRLVEIKVAPGAARSLLLGDLVGRDELGGVSAVVHSTNGVGIVAEREMWFDTSDVEGISAEIGVTAPERGWVLAPATAAPASDVVYVMNPSASDATLDVVFLREDGSVLSPAATSDIELPAGSRIKLPVLAYTRGLAMFARVTATTPVVAERFSYSRSSDDAASVMGIPLTQTAP